MKKKFPANRCDFYIRCIKTVLPIKTPVNDRKSKQDKNLQNPFRTRTKNKRGARKYPLREKTLHHPTDRPIISNDKVCRGDWGTGSQRL